MRRQRTSARDATGISVSLARGVGKERGLVVAPAEQPHPVKRDRHQQIGVGEACASRPGQPSAIGRRGVGGVGILEAEHQIAAGIVVDHDRAGPGIARRCGGAGPAKGLLADVVGERKSAARAMGFGDEAHLAPAIAAQAARSLDQRAAPEALGRKQDVHGARGQVAGGAGGQETEETGGGDALAAVFQVIGHLYFPGMSHSFLRHLTRISRQGHGPLRPKIGFVLRRGFGRLEAGPVAGA